MKRSVYSLVLADDVVKAVDRAAHEHGTSRSNLINQILAEYCSFVTPEKRIQSVFQAMEERMRAFGGFQVIPHASDTMLTLRSVLEYKYKPAVRYSVEMYRQEGREIGRLSVSFRTQNQQLIAVISQFFKLWDKLEQSSIGRMFESGSVPSRITPGKYVRELVLPFGLEAGGVDLGEAIAGYIRRLDQTLKAFFSHLSDPLSAVEQAEAAYSSGLSRAMVIL